MDSLDPDPQERSIAFFAAWGVGFDEMCASFSVLGEDGIWDQRPIPPIRGSRRATAFLRATRALVGLNTIEVDVVSVATEGHVVHTQRVDRLCRRDGTIIVSADVAGVLVWDGGRLVHWREHFDAASFSAGVLAGTAKHAVRRLTAAR